MESIVQLVLFVVYVPVALLMLWVLLCYLVFHREDLVPTFIRRWIERGKSN